jgi:integrase
MASIHKTKGRKPFYCSFKGIDGKWHFKTTGSTDKKDAQEICDGFEKASNLARAGRLSQERARELIEQTIKDIFETTGDEFKTDTIRGHFQAWLKTKHLETEESTYQRYKSIVDRFLLSLGSRADKSLVTLRSENISSFRDKEAEKLSKASVNLSLKTLRMALQHAVDSRAITSNPATSVKNLKAKGESKRRPFTIAEIKRLLEHANDEWKGLILTGTYTALRLGDCARLTWQALDLKSELLSFTTKKTGNRVHIPIAKPLLNYFMELETPDDPSSPLFPKAYEAGKNKVVTLSNQFYQIMVAAGLADARSHEAKKRSNVAADATEKEKRGAARETSELSFHSLRHSFVTALKATGASNAVAEALAGHESSAVSRGYTHLSADDLRPWIDKMKDVTEEAK